MIGCIQWIRLILKIKVDDLELSKKYLDHFGNFEGGDVLVQVEIIFFDEEDVGGGEHFLGPLEFDGDVAFFFLVDDHKPDFVVCSEGDEIGLIFFFK